MKKFLIALLVCSIASFSSYKLTKAAYSYYTDVPFTCELEALGTGSGYNGVDDTAYATWHIDCVQGQVTTNCAGAVLITVWQLINNSYVPVGSKCIEYGFDCGDNYPVFTTNLQSFRSTYGFGDFKITWVFIEGTCDATVNTLDRQDQYLSFHRTGP